MKTGLSLLAVIAVALAGAVVGDEIEEKYKEMGMQCYEITKPSSEEMKRIENKQKPLTAEGRQFYGCMINKMGLISIRGETDKQKCIEILEASPDSEKEKLSKSIEEICDDCCSKQYNSNTDYEGGYEMLICFETHAPEPLLKDR